MLTRPLASAASATVNGRCPLHPHRADRITSLTSPSPSGPVRSGPVRSGDMATELRTSGPSFRPPIRRRRAQGRRRVIDAGMDREDIDQAGDRQHSPHLLTRRGQQHVEPVPRRAAALARPAAKPAKTHSRDSEPRPCCPLPRGPGRRGDMGPALAMPWQRERRTVPPASASAYSGERCSSVRSLSSGSGEACAGGPEWSG
jgi:hypothetical protein